MKIMPTDIDATGTLDATTFLRGDGTWDVPAGGGGGGGGGSSKLYLPIVNLIGTSGITSTAATYARAPFPPVVAGQTVTVKRIILDYILVGTGNWTVSLAVENNGSAGSTSLGSVNVATASSGVHYKAYTDINVALSDGADITVTVTENSGSATFYPMVSIEVDIVTGSTSGTSFPGSPSTGQVFYRTDRNIEYFYDGARWLSTNLYSICPSISDAVSPYTASRTGFAANPHSTVYDIWVETLTVGFLQTAGVTSANYFTAQIQYGNAGAATSVGGTVSSQSITLSTWTTKTLAIGASIPMAASAMSIAFTETGAATAYCLGSFTYRLVG